MSGEVVVLRLDSAADAAEMMAFMVLGLGLPIDVGNVGLVVWVRAAVAEERGTCCCAGGYVCVAEEREMSVAVDVDCCCSKKETCRCEYGVGGLEEKKKKRSPFAKIS